MTDAANTTESDTSLLTGDDATAASENQSTTQVDDTATVAESDAAGKEEGKTEGDKKPEGAPEAYELNPGEGQEFDNDVLTAFQDAAREHNLTNDAAQGILTAMGPAMQARQERAIQQWADDTKADPEVGGDKLEASLATAKKAVEAFGSDAFKDLLNVHGLGNHPEFVRVFNKVGLAISEDGFVGGKDTSKASGPKSFEQHAQTLYPQSS